MPAAVITSLRALRAEQAGHKLALGAAYHDDGLVFADEAGQPAQRQHIHRGFAKVCEQAGIAVYIPREARHTFVSVLDDSGMSIEQISAAVGHVNSNVTRQVYRHVLADQISAAATAWDAITGTEATS